MFECDASNSTVWRLLTDLAREFPHARFGSIERVSQFREVRNFHLSKSGFEFLLPNVVMTHKKCHISHILRVIAPHHFCKNQVERCRPKQPQPEGGSLNPS